MAVGLDREGLRVYRALEVGGGSRWLRDLF